MRIKIVSLNIWQGRLLDDACAFINSEQPDIVVLQEVYNGADLSLPPGFRTLEELKKRLDLQHYYYEPALIDNREEGKIPQGNATFSRFPISSKKAIFFDQPFRDDYIDTVDFWLISPRALLYTALETPEGTVHVYNVHGPWDLVGENFGDNRRKMSEAIIATTKDKPNVIVAGDTNAKPVNQAILDIEKHLTSVFGHSLATTFNMSQKSNPGYASAAVDMVFVSSDMGVVQKRCPQVNVSDHLPLIVTLDVAGVRATTTAEPLESVTAL